MVAVDEFELGSAPACAPARRARGLPVDGGPLLWTTRSLMRFD